MGTLFGGWGSFNGEISCRVIGLGQKMSYSERVRHLLYPFTDVRSVFVALPLIGFNLAYFVFVLFWVGICVWADRHNSMSTDGSTPTIVILAAFAFMAFVLVALLGAVIYVGFLVAANREGWRKSGRLPKLRWGAMFRQGLGASLFSGLAAVVPYYALVFAFVAGVFAVSSLSDFLTTRNETLGVLTTLLGIGGVGAAFLVALFCFMLLVLTLVPLMQARYAATGELSSYFRVSWAVRTVALAPGKFLLYQLPILTFVFSGGVIHIITLGIAGIFLVLLFPYVQLNQAYLMGRFYGEVIGLPLGDEISESALAEVHRSQD